MSWSFTVNDISELGLDHPDWLRITEQMLTQHPAYPGDMLIAMNAFKEAGLKSGSLTGFRTPNPYGGPEVVEISIRGFAEPLDFNEMIKRIIETGGQVNEQARPSGHDPVHRADDT